MVPAGFAALTVRGQPALGGSVLAPTSCAQGSSLQMAPYNPGDTTQLWWYALPVVVGGDQSPPPAGIVANVGCGQEIGWGPSGPVLDGAYATPQPGKSPCPTGGVTDNVQVNSDNTMSMVDAAGPVMWMGIDPDTQSVVGTTVSSNATAWDAQVC